MMQTKTPPEIRWCSMVYERLLVTRSLLSKDGIIFISIDDNEIENLKKICNEVFIIHIFRKYVYALRFFDVV